MEFKLLVAGAILFVLSRLMGKIKHKITNPRFQKIYKEVHEWVETGWSAVILAAFLMYFFIQAFKIPSGSMRMTLLEGDHLFVSKFAYGFHVPFSNGKRLFPLRQVQRGDIIVFKCPPEALSFSERENNVTKDFIKRCVAVGGDMVWIKDKKLYVNNEIMNIKNANFIDESLFPSEKLFTSEDQYQQTWENGKFSNLTSSIMRDNFGPVIVPPGHYFVMGDNRDRSFDSRFWGPLDDNLLKGRALLLYWPFKRIKIIK